METPLQRLCQSGQSPWIDYITRDLIQSGELQRYMARGIRGLTANPTIFAQAVLHSTAYDAAIRDLAATGAGPAQIYEALIVADMRAAADILRPVYDQTRGGDGYVSIEVSPRLAHDTQATIAEARRYIHAVGRPNVFIKVPATDAGIPAIRQLIAEGINVNITLIFGIDYYEQVLEAYLAGLEQAAADGRSLDDIASVASFFVSRVDSAVDKRLDAIIDATRDAARRTEIAGLRGAAAIANARIAYQRFLTTFSSARFQALKAHGARVQRPLWASTSTKNPAYRDVRYVEELIGPDTINTMPPATIAAFEDHGCVERTIDRDVAAAYATLARLQEMGISMQDVTDTLLVDGIALFVAAIESLEQAIEDKRLALLAEQSTHKPIEV